MPFDKALTQTMFEEVFSAADEDLRDQMREHLHAIRTDIQSDRDGETDETAKQKLTELDELFETTINAIDAVDTEQSDDDGEEDPSED
jgi:hypothetical protein